MKRRDTFRLIPLTLAGMGSMYNQATAEPYEKIYQPAETDEPPCLLYPKVITDILNEIRATQSEKILEASYAIARTVKRKNTVWCNWDLGHSSNSDIFPERNGKPAFITHGYDPEKAKNGDLLMSSMSFRQVDDLSKKDIFVIGGPAITSGDAKLSELNLKSVQENRIRPYSNIWIETNVTAIGPRIYIPGMVSPIGPVSGPVYATLFWMMIADTCRILAIDDKPVNIEGDEPKLSGNNIPWMDMSEPIMDDYFDEIIRELQIIRSELGELRKIAKIAVDTLLDGGKVYFYSRYRYSFASEATGRRGGLTLANAISDGNIEGTSKDCVIMGIYKPDDEADLKNLDEFKKRGMRIASVGPISRDTVIPEGRAVYKETEAHIGRFVETYGQFAIPGYDKKVCPTSGIMNTSILWCICVEIVSQLIERTNGNVPWIRGSGSLEKTRILRPHLQGMFRERGY